jgi:L-malate glycosyltransferase
MTASSPPPLSPAAWPRICVVGNFPPSHGGGLPSQGELLAAHLAADGAPVTLLSRRMTKAGRLADALTGLLGGGWRWDVYCIQVFTFRATVLELTAMLAARIWRRRIVLVMRDGRLIRTLDRWPALAAVYRRADAIVYPSAFLQEGLRPRRLTGVMIPNVVDLQHYAFRLRTVAAPRLLFMRTFHPLYNPQLALRVYRRVKDRRPDAILTMAGMDRNYLDSVRKAAREMGLDDVRFPGFVEKRDVPALMADHDIYLNTPHIDNTPVSVIESLASGLPVVSTRVGGIPYLLDEGKTGLLVPDDDDAAMAEAVFRLVEKPGLSETLSKEGRKMAESFTWAHVREQWRTVLSGSDPAPVSASPADASPS